MTLAQALALDPPASVLLYDGDCGLCHQSVQFVLRHDVAGRVYFLPLQSPSAQAYARARGVPIQLDTIYFIHHGQLYTKSRAVAQLLQLLPMRRYQLLARLLHHYPRPLADRAYDLVARYRHRLPGLARPACLLPSTEHTGRFLT